MPLRCQEWQCWLVAGTKLLLTWHSTNIWPWVPAGLDARSDRAGWLSAVSYCSALLLTWVLDFDFDSVTRVEAGPNTFTVTLRVVRGDEKGSLKSETVKYGRESQGTQTRERLCWQGSAAYTKDRPVFSSERAPNKKQNRNCQAVINIWSCTPAGARNQDLLTDWLTDWLTVSRNVTSLLRLDLSSEIPRKQQCGQKKN
jgi:hypothetical protein